MTIKSKILGLVVLSMVSFGVVGCSTQSTNTEESQQVATDEQFIADFEKAINKRWVEQEKLNNKSENNLNYTESQFAKDTIKILEAEISTLEENKEGIADKELREVANNYIEGVKKQIESAKTNDADLMLKYIGESEKLRKPALIAMVDEYKIKIDKKNEQIYKDFKAQATIINKENEAQAFADKLASEMNLEKSKDEFGDVVFSSIVENTSDLDYKTLSFNVQYKDADDVVIGDDYINLENFAPDSKQKVKLTPYEDGVNKVIITTDWFETK